MIERYSRGEVARIYLDIISAGVGQVGLAPTASIRRMVDNQWFQASDNSWQTTIINNAMTALDGVNFAGRYYIDFDQAEDDEEESYEYVVRLSHIAAPVTLEYRELVFAPLSASIAPGLCAVTGTVYTGRGKPAPNEIVQATLVPVYTDALSRTAQADQIVGTYTNESGDFSLSLIRGATFRLQINTVGYDHKVVIPDQATVAFMDL
jgi:hypothetical protein